jgi:hypothetical protein
MVSTFCSRALISNRAVHAIKIRIDEIAMMICTCAFAASDKITFMIYSAQ